MLFLLAAQNNDFNGNFMLFLAWESAKQIQWDSMIQKDITRFFVDGETLTEVRLWAAMRTQTVAKTVVGALQCASGRPSPLVKRLECQVDLRLYSYCSKTIGITII